VGSLRRGGTYVSLCVFWENLIVELNGFCEILMHKRVACYPKVCEGRAI
jgi:hypothetical protein